MKKIELLVPTDLHSIPLYQYQEFLKTFENVENMTDEEASLKMLKIFCGLTQKEGLTFKMSDVSKVVDKLNKILVTKPSLITKFTLGDQKFGFVPELSDLSFGEYIDAENNLGDWDNMHKAMARNNQDEQTAFGAEEDFRVRYGWYNSLYKLAGGDVTKIEEVSKTNLHYCLTMLQYKIELDKAETKNLKNKFKNNER